MPVPKFSLLTLKPLDSLFFGPNLGLELSSNAASLLFPLPWTVSGALIAHLVSKKGTLSEILESDASLEREERGELTKLMFYGPFLIHARCKWFPTPYDLKYEPAGSSGALYSSQLPPIIEVVEKIPAWIDEARLEKYVRGEEIEVDSGWEEPKLLEEVRLGIAVDDSTRTAMRGFLYTSRHLRMQDSAIGILAAWKTGEPLDLSGIVRLGGEGKASIIEVEDWNPSWFEDERIERGSVVKLVLISPAIYWDSSGKTSRRPPNERLEKLPGRPEVCKSRGRELVIGPSPVMVSGWDLARRRARRMYAAVPAGTTIYLRLKEETGRWELTREFWKLSLYWERGFGSPLVARARGDLCE